MLYYLVNKDNKYYNGKGFGAFSKAISYTNNFKAMTAKNRINQSAIIIEGSDDGSEPVLRYSLDLTPSEIAEVKRSLAEAVVTVGDRILQRELVG